MDKEINTQDPTYKLLLTIHLAWSHGLQNIFAGCVGVCRCYIALSLVDILNMKVKPHPKPHYLDLEGRHHVRYQCKVSFKIGHHEDEILCNVVDIHSVSIILGREWMNKWHVRYSMSMKTFIYPWMKKIVL